MVYEESYVLWDSKWLTLVYGRLSEQRYIGWSCSLVDHWIAIVLDTGHHRFFKSVGIKKYDTDNVPLYNFHLPSRVLISLTLAISFIKTVKYPLYLKDQYVPIISHTYTTYYILSSVLWCPLRFSHKNDLRFVFTSGCL